VPECGREASIMRMPWPTRGCCDKEEKAEEINSYLYIPHLFYYIGEVRYRRFGYSAVRDSLVP
jgi:hypothetical protein